jgi:hypothetical protein
MAKLADAADLKSAGPKGLWGFDSPSRHQSSSKEILRLRSGFRLRAPVRQKRRTHARKAAQLKIRRSERTVGVRFPLPAPAKEILRRKKRGSGFRLRAPVRQKLLYGQTL